MIHSRQKTETDLPAEPRNENPAPDLGTLAKIACLANAPFAALLLIAGKTGWALSLVAGALVSLVMCGMLAMMVGRMHASLASRSHDGLTSVDEASEKLKFVVIVIAKFIIVSLLFCAIVGLHANLMGVLAGFVITQIAIVIWAAKRLKKQ